MIDGDKLVQLAQTDTHINDIKAIGRAIFLLLLVFQQTAAIL